MTLTAEDINTKISYVTRIWWTEVSFGGGEHSADLHSETYPADQTFIERLAQEDQIDLDVLKPEGFDDHAWEFGLNKIALIKQTASDIVVDNTTFPAPIQEESLKNIYVNAKTDTVNGKKSVIILVYEGKDIIDELDEQKTVLFKQEYQKPRKQIYPSLQTN